MINTLLIISFMRKKNVFSQEIFFCQQVDGHSRFVTMACHRHVTQNKKFSPCCGHSCRFQQFLTSGWHYNMLATCWWRFQLRSDVSGLLLLTQDMRTTCSRVDYASSLPLGCLPHWPWLSYGLARATPFVLGITSCILWKRTWLGVSVGLCHPDSSAWLHQPWMQWQQRGLVLLPESAAPWSSSMTCRPESQCCIELGIYRSGQQSWGRACLFRKGNIAHKCQGLCWCNHCSWGSAPAGRSSHGVWHRTESCSACSRPYTWGCANLLPTVCTTLGKIRAKKCGLEFLEGGMDIAGFSKLVDADLCRGLFNNQLELCITHSRVYGILKGAQVRHLFKQLGIGPFAVDHVLVDGNNRTSFYHCLSCSWKKPYAWFLWTRGIIWGWII